MVPSKTIERNNPLAVRLDPDDLDWLRDERGRSGVSVNRMIATAVRQYVRQRKGVRARRAA